MATNEYDEPEDPTKTEVAADIIRLHLLAPATPTGEASLGTLILVLIVMACLVFTPQPYGLIGILALTVIGLRWPRSKVVSSRFDRQLSQPEKKKGA